MASKIEVKDLLEAGVHFGHLTRKWNPNMAPYIYMERNGIHVINLYKTAAKLEEANEALKKIAASGRKILFVATKKQAKDIVADKVSKVNMPYITERWPGGMLTNFVTIRKAVKKMAAIDRMKKDGTFNTLSKKERLQVDRLRAKLEKNLGSIADMTRLPGALFIVDTMREHIAVKEAQKLNIPIFAMVDTNSDPRDVDFAIPSNDDAGKSIEIILEHVTKAVAEGLEERKNDKGSGKDKEDDTTDAVEETPKKKEKAAEEKPAKKAEAAATKEEKPAEEKPAKKEAEAKPEDLTKIEGIGPKAAEALVANGLSTYAALADTDAEKIKEILTEASSTLAHLDPTSWPKQAKMAAEGNWDELKEWQDSVKGGVE
ncbi:MULTISPECIES: 30S ribosomal protein S2 [unclassified Allomuricauda]|jgi:small subunit ribosomal protein S2|uniref:30S ribosomal protein S2 n=1 Tax=Flavobacteriaceae TaxID=49546 RepID=UPI0015CD08E8|nr:MULTISPECIES: 30S ribosomal protein S2 [unclassified Allomuricauda]MBO6531978.1 30S ribosomal protein S2 [Allomuricauda sp.]MBO6589937.1 30S ribosomal protein S2 [Allomuricauda sp.]MBO6619563.1 30S ribosomal protein S2 [Allomuricauda sp.]MBO6645468.1 30S ribosomal protein S2 [Allomuricauda sp.]MBO6747675.1 30S ribosomal protein S2 [Allomuricauda sp.]